MKRKIDQDYETENREKSEAIRKLHYQQLSAKHQRESRLKDHLNEKYQQRLSSKHEY